MSEGTLVARCNNCVRETYAGETGSWCLSQVRVRGSSPVASQVTVTIWPACPVTRLPFVTTRAGAGNRKGGVRDYCT